MRKDAVDCDHQRLHTARRLDESAVPQTGAALLVCGFCHRPHRLTDPSDRLGEQVDAARFLPHIRCGLKRLFNPQPTGHARQPGTQPHAPHAHGRIQRSVPLMAPRTDIHGAPHAGVAHEGLQRPCTRCINQPHPLPTRGTRLWPWHLAGAFPENVREKRSAHHPHRLLKTVLDRGHISRSRDGGHRVQFLRKHRSAVV
jgi:hypothetical protein